MLHLGLNEREIEKVLAGHQPAGRSDLAEVAYFFARLRTLGDFEQAPPMSPQLLAELDAAEADPTTPRGAPAGRVAEGERDAREAREARDPHAVPAEAGGDEVAARRAAHAGRAGQARNRWRLVGAAAAVAIVLGGVVALDLHDTTDRPETEIDDDVGPADGASTTVTTPAPPPTQPATTTAPPTTAAPPPTEPPVETTEPPPAATVEPEGPVEAHDGHHDWPGPLGPESWLEHMDDHCERNPQDDICGWYLRYRDYDDGVDGGGDRDGDGRDGDGDRHR
jgi:hypothetical protein